MAKGSAPTPSGHRARKRFGQNFLVDIAVIQQIVRSIAPKKDDHLVEIGPGQGAITAPLLEINPTLQVIELDRDLIPVLLAQFAKYKGFRIHQEDALQCDFSRLFPQQTQDLRIIGNLPYNISTPLIFRLLGADYPIHDMHFMLQKEVVDRLVAVPGQKNYGRLGIMAQYYCQVEKLFEVPPESFDPPPKVTSAFVRLNPYSKPPLVACNTRNLKRLVTTAFQQRRKTLRNALKSIVGETEAARAGLDLSQRAENLSLEQYVNACNRLWGENDIGGS